MLCKKCCLLAVSVYGRSPSQHANLATFLKISCLLPKLISFTNSYQPKNVVLEENESIRRRVFSDANVFLNSKFLVKVFHALKIFGHSSFLKDLSFPDTIC